MNVWSYLCLPTQTASWWMTSWTSFQHPLWSSTLFLLLQNRMGHQWMTPGMHILRSSGNSRSHWKGQRSGSSGHTAMLFVVVFISANNRPFMCSHSCGKLHTKDVLSNTSSWWIEYAHWPLRRRAVMSFYCLQLPFFTLSHMFGQGISWPSMMVSIGI